ncbi:LysR family transcriptional regulator [uncultured Tateyamaria sp.]|uniref:LysR family transcriptional regulator n=1 Tax=uncultured Tateyamaria sp. TaxID=455651 RepID=UPI002618CE51|nr:LysR family transcriptional regulator [uncultured Tateyamaria sp.]
MSRLLKVDFAALRTLQYVHDLKSFSLASERLGQTQSNVSYTIAKLRDCFGDPLFVREGNASIPTDRCRAIVQHAAGLLEEFQGVATSRAFSPDTAEGLVTISCNHYERMIVLPKLINTCRAQAPNVRLRVMNSFGRGEEQLKRGECDLLMGPVNFLGEHVFKRRLLEDYYVCVMDPDNPLAQGDLTAQGLRTAKFLTVSFAGHWQPLYFANLETHGITVEPVVELAEYGDMRGYIAGTDLVAILPNRIARPMSSDLVQRPLPSAVPLALDIFWTTRTHQAPLHKWIREVACAAVKASG